MHALVTNPYNYNVFTALQTSSSASWFFMSKPKREEDGAKINHSQIAITKLSIGIQVTTTCKTPVVCKLNQIKEEIKIKNYTSYYRVYNISVS